MMDKKRLTQKNNPKASHKDTVEPPDWLDRIDQFQVHFGRFLWDVSSVLAFAIALLLLVGIFGFAKGTLLDGFSRLLHAWLGWGSFLIVGLFLYAGILAYQHNRNPIVVNWHELISIEVSAILSLGILSILGGNSLVSIENGGWGGRIGWGLVTILQKVTGQILGIIILIVAWIVLLMDAFHLWAKVEHWLQKQSGLEQVEAKPSKLGESEIEQDPTPTHKKVTKKAPLKPSEKIPPEFRKSFSIPENKSKPAFSPILRGDDLPSLGLLTSEQTFRPDERNINQTAGLIEKTLADFGIPARVVGFRIGPTVTQFAVEPGFFDKGGQENGDPNRQKVRIAQIAGLNRDLALALSAERLRIEAPVPGKSYVGIEVPNARSVVVRMRSILESEEFTRLESKLGIALGRDVSGHPVVADLSRMPHLLIAGTTGSGKSVCISSLATCLAMNNSPQDLRLVMIDSKMVELIRFNGLPHLFGKVETDIQRILGVLRWVVVEMEYRYKLLESAHVRDLNGYNKRVLKRKDGDPLPRIVVLIDELADLMMSAQDQTEHNLVRLAQMARATGIHLVVATQRPSTDVVTGLIKANFPARISFSVASGVDSRVILDTAGAETLLGHGDMLFLNPEIGNPIRAQGVMVTDQEIERLISHWQNNWKSSGEQAPWEKVLLEVEEGEDARLFEHAILILKKEQRASASLLQRRLRIGYPRAARLLDHLEEIGVVGPSTGGGRDRDVLLEPEDDGLENN